MLLLNFPKDIAFAILIVQHMPHGFTGPLARRLDNLCHIHVKEAEDNDRIEPGVALIAPSGLHMKIRKVKKSIKLSVEPADLNHRPSVDVLFQSVAENYKNRSLGVIMTGMGSDGKKGIQLIKRHGGTTFAQDEATSTIFGMPKAAIESGAVDRIFPITSLAENILNSVYR
jgi:two-component system chemotaxis response regulator CheB